MEAPSRQLVDRLRENLVRHEAAQQRLDDCVSLPPESVNDYMRATRQVLALAVRALVSRVDLWLLGGSSILDACSAMDELPTAHSNLPFDLTRIIPVAEISQLALDVDEVDFHSVPVQEVSRDAAE